MVCRKTAPSRVWVTEEKVEPCEHAVIPHCYLIRILEKSTERFPTKTRTSLALPSESRQGATDIAGLSTNQTEICVIGRAVTIRLVAVGHDSNAHEIRHIGFGITVGKVLAELGVEIDALVAPGVECPPRLEDNRVLRHKGIALLVTHRTLRALSGPHILERVPLQEALPTYVDDRC